MPMYSAEELAAYRNTHPNWAKNNETILKACDPEKTPVEVGWVYEMKDGVPVVVRRIHWGKMALTPDTTRQIVPASKFDKKSRDTTYYNIDNGTDEPNELAKVSIQEVKNGVAVTQLKYKTDEHGFKRPFHCPQMSSISLEKFLDNMTGVRIKYHGDGPLISEETKKKTFMAMAEAFAKVNKENVKIMPEIDTAVAKRKERREQ